jgi:SAM-dependent methyltransferase
VKFDRLRAALHHKVPVDDGAFDAVYPRVYRVVSSCYWTPVATAQQAAAMLADAGAKRVLDVGAGVGKFCIVAALGWRTMSFVGIEQRARLVGAARRAARLLDVPARVEWGRAEEVSVAEYDGFYFFNPFLENLFDAENRLDDAVELSKERYERDVNMTREWLRMAQPGTPVVTYCALPCEMAGLELVEETYSNGGTLRLWVKECAAAEVAP